MKRVEEVGQSNAGDDVSLVVFDSQRFVVLTGRGGVDAVRRVDSATVPRKDGTYVNKLTLQRVIDVDAGQYVCLITNNAGCAFRRVHLTVSPREYFSHTQFLFRYVLVEVIMCHTLIKAILL